MSTTMTLRLEDDVKARLDRLADATHRSKSGTARRGWSPRKRQLHRSRSRFSAWSTRSHPNWRRAADPRDKETPEPPMPKDEFVLKFVKPGAAGG